MDCASCPSIGNHCCVRCGLRAFGEKQRYCIVETIVSGIDGGVLLRDEQQCRRAELFRLGECFESTASKIFVVEASMGCCLASMGFKRESIQPLPSIVAAILRQYVYAGTSKTATQRQAYMQNTTNRGQQLPSIFKSTIYNSLLRTPPQQSTLVGQIICCG